MCTKISPDSRLTLPENPHHHIPLTQTSRKPDACAQPSPPGHKHPLKSNQTGLIPLCAHLRFPFGSQPRCSALRLNLKTTCRELVIVVQITAHQDIYCVTISWSVSLVLFALSQKVPSLIPVGVCAVLHPPFTSWSHLRVRLPGDTLRGYISGRALSQIV